MLFINFVRILVIRKLKILGFSNVLNNDEKFRIYNRSKFNLISNIGWGPTATHTLNENFRSFRSKRF